MKSIRRRRATMENLFYHVAGAIIIFLNAIRHALVGYRTPRTFSPSDIEKSIAYDFSVVENWMKHYLAYTSEKSIAGKVVCELGPGPDLGIGLILLAMGAAKYTAVDAHSMLNQTPHGFYARLWERLVERFPGTDVAELKEELAKGLSGRGNRLKHVIDPAFRLRGVEKNINVVFSQAAIEHFDDPRTVFGDLGGLMVPEGVLISQIDLKTHTSWIRDRDPLNIYRYSDGFWNLFRFKGSPNRVRAVEYSNVLQLQGWRDVRILPVNRLDRARVQAARDFLSGRYRHMDLDELSLLSIMVQARR